MNTEPSFSYYSSIIEQIIDICNEMVSEGFVKSSEGNVSARVQLPNGQEAFLVTPSNLIYKNMRTEDFVLINEEGKRILGTRIATIEKKLHLAIYNARKDINAIIHTHAPCSTYLSKDRTPISERLFEANPQIGGCETADFAIEGTMELASNAVKALGENLAVLLENHGNVCCGATLEQAWLICQQVELWCNFGTSSTTKKQYKTDS